MCLVYLFIAGYVRFLSHSRILLRYCNHRSIQTSSLNPEKTRFEVTNLIHCRFDNVGVNQLLGIEGVREDTQESTQTTLLVHASKHQ